MSEESMKISENYIENEKIGKLIMKFSIPCVIAMVVNALYSTVDQIFIGHGMGYIGNAATNVTFPFVVLALGFSLLLGDGAAAFYSIKLGEKNKEYGAMAIGNAIVLLVILGLIFLAVGYIFMDKLLWSFGATSNNVSIALDYMRIILIGLPFMILAAGLNSIIRADGSPEYSMLAMIIGAVINIILNPIFIFLFAMGVKGSALATVIGQILSCIISLMYFKRFKNIRFKREYLKLDINVSKEIMLLGASSLITQLAVTVIIIVSNNMLKDYGAQSIYGSDIPISAVGIVMKVNEILLGVVIGIAIGGQPIIGYNYGAKNFTRVKDTYFMLIKVATIVSIIGFIIFQFFPQSIINLFGQNDLLYNEFSLKSFKIFLRLCMFIGFELTTCIFFQAIGHPIKAIILTLCKQTLFIVPLMIILPKFLGVLGVLYAGPCAEMLSVIVAIIFITLELRKMNKYVGIL
ncbi:MATE family efflux transporter [Clostridium saccharobutylicum]|nr:MATE family efflux transporter [Clostridium saccharobutylicum]MBC2415029.1 MATE family efflux transporter [Clostridium saccharobutylicum]MBC2443000.1 MATE family efflux transporter [Clostridium saccharobutylicum]MBC2447211.1 MATE family efflux transporter [Clostridium saccharobutylicum]MBC2451395.1 MATE family efflux transporter [Clostridium saccharobutylicum]